MRSSRFTKAVLAALTGAAVAAAPAVAQQAAAQQAPTKWDVQPNSWYWGAYGGQTALFTTVSTTLAPTMGIDWMITRKNFALNVFAEQAYFNAQSTVFSSDSLANVAMQDMRRIGLAAMVFLPQVRVFHPWFSAGYAFNYVTNAAPVTAVAAGPARDTLLTSVESARAQGKLFGSLGVMVAYRQWAPFAEFTMMPTTGSSSWLVNGGRSANIWKAGLRYRFGPSISDRW